MFRQPDAWGTENREALIKFVEKTIRCRAKYNLTGVARFVSARKKHEESVHENLIAYFEGRMKPKSPYKKSYFCSEFVADCFVAIGFISESAQVLYRSDVVSPGQLGQDPTYGTFLGYIPRNRIYVIPRDDQFIHDGTFQDVFGP